MESNFVCCVCHKIPSNVVESDCCHSLFCWDCVVGTPRPCPSCTKLLDPTTCSENLAVKKIIDSIEVGCTFGCAERFLVSERSAHEGTCVKGSTLCPNSDLCGIIERGVIAQHLRGCQYRRIECHMCELSLPLPHLQEHLDTTCPEVVAECQLCRAKILRKNILSFAGRGFNLHTEIACPNVEGECPFASFGCTERPFRSQVDSHVNENTALHIGLMANAFQAQQVQITSLQEQLAIAQEATNNRFDPETGVLYQCDQQLTSFVNRVKESEAWNHSAVAHLRSQVTPRRALAVLFSFFLLFKLTLCLVIGHRCAIMWTGVKIVKIVVKCLLLVKLCAMVVARVWGSGWWGRNHGHSMAAALGLVVLLVLIF